jgi:hypothetical protein
MRSVVIYMRVVPDRFSVAQKAVHCNFVLRQGIQLDSPSQGLKPYIFSDLNGPTKVVP